MNKTLVVAVLVVVIVIGIAAAYIGTMQTVQPTVTTVTTVIAPPTTGPKHHKVLFAALTAADDKSWNQFQVDGLRAAAAASNGQIEVTVQDQVSVADFPRVVTGYISNGYDLIVGCCYEYQQAILQIAPQYPNVAFVSYGASQFGPNTAGYNIWPHEGFYLAGQLAGLMTKSGVIGYVDAFKYPYDLCARNAFITGVKSVSNATVLEAWVGTWSDLQKGFEAANAMMDAGADILIHDASGPGNGMLQAASQRGKLAIGAYYDQSYMGDYVLTSVANKFQVPLNIILADIDAGRFGGKSYDFGMKEGGVDLSAFSSKVPQDIRDKVMDTRDKILKGLIQVPFVPDRELTFGSSSLSLGFLVAPTVAPYLANIAKRLQS